MDEKQFERTLMSVGQTCFVNFYEYFSSSMANEDVIEVLRSQTDYTENSCRSRTGHARRIIREGFAVQAFKVIIASESARVTDETRAKARQFLNAPRT